MKQALLLPNGMPMINNKIHISSDKKVFFVSDHHLGLDEPTTSLSREKLFVKWLDDIKSEAQVLFILGDMFDYWYEYKRTVPKGFVRVLGKLAELTDYGLPIYFFVGNHDMWMIDYLEKEIGLKVYFEPQEFEINQQNFLIGHGDGLGPGDKNFKRLKKLFTNRLAQWTFRWLHPDIGLKLVKYLSQRNKLLSGNYDYHFHGKDREWLFLYAKDYLKHTKINNFIFGHRHLPLAIPINQESTYYNTGDWLQHYTYLVFDGKKMIEKKYNP